MTICKTDCKVEGAEDGWVRQFQMAFGVFCQNPLLFEAPFGMYKLCNACMHDALQTWQSLIPLQQTC